MRFDGFIVLLSILFLLFLAIAPQNGICEEPDNNGEPVLAGRAGGSGGVTPTPDPLENYEWHEEYAGKLKERNKSCTQPHKFEAGMRKHRAKRDADEDEGQESSADGDLEKMADNMCAEMLFLECVVDQTSENYEKYYQSGTGVCECSAKVGGKRAVVDGDGKCRIPVGREWASECDETEYKLPYQEVTIKAECTENAVCQRHGTHTGRRCYCKTGLRPRNGTCQDISGATVPRDNHLVTFSFYFVSVIIVFFTSHML